MLFGREKGFSVPSAFLGLFLPPPNLPVPLSPTSSLSQGSNIKLSESANWLQLASQLVLQLAAGHFTVNQKVLIQTSSKGQTAKKEKIPNQDTHQEGENSSPVSK